MSMTKQMAHPTDAQGKILSATLTLFTAKGYFNTAVHDIARVSGLSVGTIYHHFHDKEGIAKALYADVMARMHSELAAILANHTTAHDRCRAVVELLFQLTEQEPEVMGFMLFSKHREFLPDERPVCSSQPFETMRRFIREGMRSGEIREMDLMVASTCLFGGVIRMITLSMDGLLTKPLAQHIEEVWSCSWKAISN